MRKTSFRMLGLLVVVAMLMTGCRSEEKPSEPEQPSPEASTEEPEDLLAVDIEIPPGGEGSTESASGESDPACVGGLELADATVLEIPDWNAEVNGYRATLTRDGDDPGHLTLGVIADIKEDTGENMFNIGRLVEWWRSENVDAVVVAGDAGETEPGLARALGALADPGWPVFVTIGNREAREVYTGALAKAKEAYPNVIDLTQQRLVKLPGATLLSLPGYHDPRFLHAETGCVYFREDVEALVPLAKEAEGPVLLVAHSGPRGATPQAVDFAREAGNIGDANINRLIAAADIPFGIFAHVHEAGGSATDLFGRDLIEQGAFTDSFYLNVGPADSHPWAMNDETVSRGMGGLVRVKGDEAAYQIHRHEALTDEEQALAKRFDPPSEDTEAEEAE